MIIVSREGWGARHDDGFGQAPLPATEVWLHHSVTKAPTPSGEKSAMRTLEQIGEDRFGRGISYTWAVMPSGTVYEGHGVDRQGAHTAGRNSRARAIVLVGDYSASAPTPAQLAAVATLLAHAYASGWIRAPRLNGGHRDVPEAATECPGTAAEALIPDINRAAARKPTSGPPPPTEPRGPEYLPELDPGMRGHAVGSLQAFMRRVFPSYAGHLEVDNDYGPQTAAVVREYQGRVGLPQVGRVGPLTNAALWGHGFRG